MSVFRDSTVYITVLWLGTIFWLNQFVIKTGQMVGVILGEKSSMILDAGLGMILPRIFARAKRTSIDYKHLLSMVDTK